MPRVRFRLRLKDRVELHTLEGDDFVLGSDAGADLRLHHSSVAPGHARFLVRRDQVIAADLGRAPTGLTRDGDRLRAPVTVTPARGVGLGEVQVSAWVDDDPSPWPRGRLASPPGLRIGREIDTPELGARRYLLVSEAHGSAELGAEPAGEVLVPGVKLDRSRWAQRVGAAGWSARTDEGLEALREPLRPGVRLTRLCAGRVEIPAEGRVLLVAELLLAAERFGRTFGEHGMIDDRRVHIDRVGTVRLLAPGPVDHFRDPLLEPYLAPERRYGFRPSRPADGYALGVLALQILGDCLPEARPLFAPLLAEDPSSRPRDLAAVAADLRSLAHRAGWDPAAVHLSRGVQVLTAQPSGDEGEEAPFSSPRAQHA